MAVIKSIDRNPGTSFTEATATPNAHLDRAREVLLVWTLSPTDDVDEPDADVKTEPKAENKQKKGKN